MTNQDHTGEPHGRAGPSPNYQTVQELQKKVLAETLLRESESLYRQLVELCPDVIFIHHDFRVRFMNRAAARLFGLPAEQIVGRDFFDFLHPDYHAEARRRAAQMIATGVAAGPWELRIVRPDGVIVPMESSAINFQD